MKKFSEILKYKKIIIGSTVALVISAFVLFSQYGLLKRLALENKKSQLIKKFKNEAITRDSLKKKKISLINDTFEIEKIAREKYGMHKKGEKIFYFEKNKN